jgi:aspartate aminotransferase
MTAGLPSMAARVAAVGESGTTRVFSLAQKLRQQGHDIISLAVGEPDFDTPETVIAATCRALEAQATRYGPVAGEPLLRQRLAEGFKGYTADNILITNGAKQALYALFQVLCDPGDEIIVPRPCWVSFPEQIRLAGGCPVLVDTRDHQLDPEAIGKAVGPRTRAILVNTPNNPSGAVYSADALLAVGRIAAAHKIFLVADEAYHAFTYDGRSHVRLFDAAPDSGSVITVRSFSKHYSMTGFRVGYVAADRQVIEPLARMQSHLSGNVCTFAQQGALAALDLPAAFVQGRCAILQQRRDVAFVYASALFGCVRPQGAFYLFADIRPCLRKDETSTDLALRLLQTAGVAVVPGEAFGCPGFIRISFGAAEEKLHNGFERIKKAL